jgi:hypothetical protein
MHRRGSTLYFIALCGFTLISAVAGEPQSQFWIIRSANEIADHLVETVEGKKLPPEELASRITALIDAKKIQQLARFDQALGKEVISRKNPTGELVCPSGNGNIALGTSVEAGVTLADDSRKANIRLAVEIGEKKSRTEYFLKALNSAQALNGDHWELMDLWKNSEESTLCLARITDYPVAAAGAELDSPATVLRVELLEIQPEDLAQFHKSTSATRSKALAWLRGRSKLLVVTTARLRPGQRSHHQDLVANLAGDRGGFTLASEQITSGDGKKVDITLSAQWQDPAKPVAKEDYHFTVGETVDAGQTRLFAPSIAPSGKGPSPVLLLTPQVSLPQDHPQGIAASKDPSTLPDKRSTQIYPVAAKFMRVIQDTQDNQDNQDNQDSNKRLPLMKALANRGLEFIPGASVTFSHPQCVVQLTHTRDGHLKFCELLKTLDLQP